MPTWAWGLLLGGTGRWGAFARAGWWLWGGNVREGRLSSGVIIRAMQVYARRFHRLGVEGMDLVPARSKLQRHDAVPFGDDEPLIVVANHVAGIDPVLIQASLPFEVRWMMAADMRIRSMEWLWTYGRILFVDRGVEGGDTNGVNGAAGGVKGAVEHLKRGGCLGVFAEGFIERPPSTLLPFQDGVGLLVRRTGARVLLAAIDGVPEADSAWASLGTRTHARVRFVELVDYRDERGRVALKPNAISNDLRERLAAKTGWPMADDQAPTPASVDA